MKILNEYPNSHHYIEEYAKTQYYCPNCGKQEVWNEVGEGDYYLGSDYVCTECNFLLHLDSSGKVGPYCMSNVLGIIKQLKTGVTNTPTTRKGR